MIVLHNVARVPFEVSCLFCVGRSVSVDTTLHPFRPVRKPFLPNIRKRKHLHIHDYPTTLCAVSGSHTFVSYLTDWLVNLFCVDLFFFFSKSFHCQLTTQTCLIHWLWKTSAWIGAKTDYDKRGVLWNLIRQKTGFLQLFAPWNEFWKLRTQTWPLQEEFNLLPIKN